MNKIFKPDIGSIVYHLVFYTFLIAFSCYAAVVGFYYLTKLERSQGYYLTVGIVALTVSSLLAGLIVFLRSRFAVQVTEQEVIIRRRNSCARYSIKSNVFTSSVVKHYQYGIYVGSTKSLVVTQSNSKKKNYNCNFIGNKDFDLLLSYISSIKLKQVAADYMEDEADEDHGSYGDMYITYNINKEQAEKNAKADLKVLILISFGLAVFVALGIFITLEDKREALRYFKSYYFLLLPILISPLVFTIGSYAVTRLRIKSSMPERIVLTSKSISFDDHRFYFRGVQSILATPITYTEANIYKNQRVMTIVQDGERYSFVLGSTSPNPRRPPVFSEYGQLCDEIKTLLVDEPEKFMFKI